LILDRETPSEPDKDCQLCPRLVAFREEIKTKEPNWYNAPVPSFGTPRPHLLIVGLAPGLKGANRTGRPFTGDFAGNLLYETLLSHGFAEGAYGASAEDGLLLTNCTITNAVRCVPPQNKPTPAEIKTCRQFLTRTLDYLDQPAVILALGKIAHESVLRAMALKLADFPFKHGAEYILPANQSVLLDSYHCSRYNTNTGVLTPQMFREIFSKAKVRLNR
jgi:uracil-DNA glycosylase family 4